MPAQLIRRSQFITTYGPGSIIEGAEGPRVIRSLDQAGLFSAHPPSRFEITDRRLSVSLLGNARILRVPSNAELGVPDSDRIYSTAAFPGWSLCVRHGVLYQKRASDNQACPRCGPHHDSFSAWRQAHREAIRFVRACEAGHLDDVDWMRVVPHSAPNCQPPYLTWTGGGGALRNVEISCPICSAHINLGAAYSRDWPCSGRQPEHGTARPGCQRPARIIQRGAANLRLAELQSALTIPPTTTRLHRLLEMTSVMAVLTLISPTKAALIPAVSALVQNNQLPASVLKELSSYSDDAIGAAIADTLAGGTATSPRDLRFQELIALRNAARFGAPPQPSGTPGAPHQFEVVLAEVRRIVLTSGRALRVTPVNRLRVVLVQTGYRRMSPAGTPIDIAHTDGAQRWYPGVELFGEGIYIDLDPGPPGAGPARHFPLDGPSTGAWMQEWRNLAALDPLERDRRHPVYVWWHIFAHRLINALSIDSGYSSTSIRERVLVDIDDTSGAAGGGILLYTVQPGGDGTLGGLVALVPQFERVLAAAFRNIDTCSNDPLCGEERFASGKYNGAACYSCALVSETSCEVRNLGLDRNVLLENLP